MSNAVATVSIFTKFVQFTASLAAKGQASAINALSSDKSRALAFADFCKTMLASGKLTPAALAKEPVEELSANLKLLPKDHPFRADLTSALATARASIPAKVLTCAPGSITYRNGTSNKCGMIEVRVVDATGRKDEICFGLAKWSQLISLIDANRAALTSALESVRSGKYSINTNIEYTGGTPATHTTAHTTAPEPTADEIAAAIL